MYKSVRTTKQSLPLSIKFTPELRAEIDARAFPGEKFTATIRRLLTVGVPVAEGTVTEEMKATVRDKGKTGTEYLKLMVGEAAQEYLEETCSPTAQGSLSRGGRRLLVLGLYYTTPPEPLKDVQELMEFLTREFKQKRQTLRETFEKLELRCSMKVACELFFSAYQQGLIRLITTPISGVPGVALGGKFYSSWEFRPAESSAEIEARAFPGELLTATIRRLITA